MGVSTDKLKIGAGILSLREYGSNTLVGYNVTDLTTGFEITITGGSNALAATDIYVKAGYNMNINEIASNIEFKINDAIGNGGVDVSVDSSGYLVINGGTGCTAIAIAAPGTGTDMRTILGIDDGAFASTSYTGTAPAPNSYFLDIGAKIDAEEAFNYNSEWYDWTVARNLGKYDSRLVDETAMLKCTIQEVDIANVCLALGYARDAFTDNGSDEYYLDVGGARDPQFWVVEYRIPQRSNALKFDILKGYKAKISNQIQVSFNKKESRSIEVEFEFYHDTESTKLYRFTEEY